MQRESSAESWLPDMPRKSIPKEQTESSLGFEQAFEALQDVVRQLESGKLTLDQSLEVYGKGVTHLRTCYSALESAEQKIRQLIDVDAQGNATTAPFGHRASVSNPMWRAGDGEPSEDQFDEDDEP